MTFPIAVIDRPGSTLSFLSSVLAKTFDYARVDEADAPDARASQGAGLDLHPRPALAAIVVGYPRRRKGVVSNGRSGLWQRDGQPSRQPMSLLPRRHARRAGSILLA